MWYLIRTCADVPVWDQVAGFATFGAATVVGAVGGAMCDPEAALAEASVDVRMYSTTHKIAHLLWYAQHLEL